MRIAAALALALAACSGGGDVASCEDDLSGVWREVGARDRGYDFRVSRSDGYEVFAMYDTARPPDGSDKLTSPIVYAPWVWDLERLPAGIAGTRLQRLTRDGKSCPLKTPVEVRACAEGKLTVAYKVPESVDFAACTASASGWRELQLAR